VFEANAAPLAVGLNIAMNNDGAGGHRIMVAGSRRSADLASVRSRS
jgi:hypothetical protein